jgi:hypothetical protein
VSDPDWAGFAPPPFKPQESVVQLKRSLADLKLSERAAGFELRGKRVVEIRVDEHMLTVRLARKLALTPEWDTVQVKAAADQRKLLDDIKKRLARWDQDD